MITLGVGFIIGAILGSFIQATSVRIAGKRSIWGRSYCLWCRARLHWYDLIPLLSYLSLAGRCRYCQKRIPFLDFVVELSLGVILALLLLNSFPQNFKVPPLVSWQSAIFWLEIIFKIFLISVFALVFLIDLSTGLILDLITIPGSMIALLYLLISSTLKSASFYQSFIKSSLAPLLSPPHSTYLVDHLLRIWSGTLWAVGSAIVAAGIFSVLIIITRGKGMGWGDVKYVFFLGLALGFPNIIAALFLAFLLGALVALLLIAAGRKHLGQTIPFGPFLSSGASLTLIYGNQLINWYLYNFRN